MAAEHDVGIKFTARAQLDAINDVISKIDKLDDTSKEHIATLTRMSREGSDAVNTMRKMYDELAQSQEAARKKGKRASEEELKDIKDKQKELQAYQAQLKIMQKEGADPFSRQVRAITEDLGIREKQYRKEGTAGAERAERSG